MHLAPHAAPAGSLLGDSADALLLRIRAGGEHRTMRITSPKCTIGSDEACTLRLTEQGVEPIHCLILRGARRTIVRRWRPGVQLNGRPFSDAAVRPGDRLLVGPCELEIVATPSEEPCDAEDDATADVANEYDSLQNKELFQNSDLAARIRELNARENTLAEDERGFLALLLEIGDRREALMHADDHRLGRFVDGQERVVDPHSELDILKELFESEQSEWNEKRDAEKADLDARRDELADHQRRLDDEQQACLAERKRLSELCEQVEAARRDIKVERTEVEASRAEISSLQAQLAQAERDLQAARAALDEERRGVVEKQSPRTEPVVTEEFEAADSTPEEISFEEVDRESPVSVRDLVAHIWEEEDDEPAAEESSSPRHPWEEFGESTSPEETHVATEDPSAAKDDSVAAEEESVEDYMARLMERVASRETTKPVVRSSQAAPVHEPANQANAFEESSPEDESETAPTGPIRPEDFVARSKATEDASLLTAMRQLANLTTREAIDRHQSRRRRLTKANSLLVAVTAATSGFLIVTTYRGTGSPMKFFGLAAMVVAVLYGVRYIAPRLGRRDESEPNLTWREDAPVFGAVTTDASEAPSPRHPPAA